MKTAYLLLNGEMVGSGEAVTSLLNRGMMYGDGCFETLRSYEGKFLLWEAHMQRLFGALAYLGIEHSLESRKLKAHTLHLLEANGLKDAHAIVRIQCWRSGGERGYLPVSSELSYCIQVYSMQPGKKPLALVTAETRSIPSASLSRKFKLSNGINFIKAAQFARKHDADDALLLTVNGAVSETTASNVFWIHNNTVFTPSENCDILAGITRKILLEIMRQKQIHCKEEAFSPAHLKSADAVFCTNSVREIQPVRSVDDVHFSKNSELLETIKTAFAAYKASYLE